VNNISKGEQITADKNYPYMIGHNSTLYFLSACERMLTKHNGSAIFCCYGLPYGSVWI